MGSNEQVCESCGNAKPTTAGETCCDTTGRMFLASRTCEKSTPTQSLETGQTFSQEDSPASLSAIQASGSDRTTLVGSGPSSPESFAFFDRDTSSWRMYQDCIAGGWETFSETWPRCGTTVSGLAFRLPRSAHHISGRGSGLLPTPTTADATGVCPPGHHKSSRSEHLKDRIGGKPSRQFLEWMMGFPSGWLEPLEMRSFRK